MKIVRIQVKNFRSIRTATLYPATHSVFLGPNNVGKTTVLEAVNLVLNPELSRSFGLIDENDFFRRNYLQFADGVEDADDDRENEDSDTTLVICPPIEIELVLSGLSEDDEDAFAEHLVPWDPASGEVVEQGVAGEDVFDTYEKAIRPCFEAWYDAEEDDFAHRFFLRTSQDIPTEELPSFTREHKRRIGFLIYRDMRGFSRPISLDPRFLFSRILESQGVNPRHFEDAISHTRNSLVDLNDEDEMRSILEAYKAEIERFLPISNATGAQRLDFVLTELTRNDLKPLAQLYVNGSDAELPLHKAGAGTRSLATLAMLTLIVRRRGRGILALEEPETFLFPHAQRRIIDECIALSNQTLITTHSPYVLERVPIEGIGRVNRTDDEVSWRVVASDTVKDCNFFSRYLRQSHCEALVGNCVVVTEGESDAWWLKGVSRHLAGTTVDGVVLQPLELLGVAVVNGDGFGDIPKLGKFFFEMGLNVVGFTDQLEFSEISEFEDSPFSVLSLRYSGLERTLSTELPIPILRVFLEQAPHAKGLPLPETETAALSDKEIRTTAETHLTNNKSSRYMHEWLISQLSIDDLPHSLVRGIAILTDQLSSEDKLTIASIV